MLRFICLKYLNFLKTLYLKTNMRFLNTKTLLFINCLKCKNVAPINFDY